MSIKQGPKRKVKTGIVFFALEKLGGLTSVSVKLKLPITTVHAWMRRDQVSVNGLRLLKKSYRLSDKRLLALNVTVSHLYKKEITVAESREAWGFK